MDISIYFIIGLITGLLFVALFCLLYSKFSKNKTKAIYDERQKAIQGVAYKIGFLVMMFYLIFNGAACDFFKPWSSNMVMNFTGVCLGIIAFAGYSIIKDAYVSVNKKEKTYLGLFIFVAIVNICCYFINSDVNYNLSSIYNINLICGITFAILAIILGVKMIVNRVSDKKDCER